MPDALGGGRLHLRVCQIEEVFAFRFTELECQRQPLQHGRRHLPGKPLFQAGVVGGTHAREHRHLLPAQARNTPCPVG